MTRDFNKPRRDDTRPSFRNQSSGRYRDERPSRPARPRLNRETVDRAWESGARQNHADYRARSDNGGSGQYPRDNWRNNHNNHNNYKKHNNQQPDYFSSQNGRDGSKPYGKHQENNRETYRERDRDTSRGFDGPPHNGNQTHRAHSSASNRADSHDSRNRRSFDDRQRSTDHRDHRNSSYGPSRSYGSNTSSGGRGAGSARPGNYRENGSAYGHDSRGPSQRERSSYNSNPNSYNPSSRSQRGPQRDYDSRQEYRGRQRRDFERSNHSFDRDERPFRGERRERGYDNSRAQSRPAAQRGHGAHENQEVTQFSHTDGLFEGDYEQFNADESDNSSHQATRDNKRSFRDKIKNTPEPAQRQQEERHVTRLPDGRVLKGSRPGQRKQAKFWTNVAEDTNTLVSQVHVEPSEGSEEEEKSAEAKEIGTPIAQESLEITSAEKSVSAAAAPKQPKRVASAAARKKKSPAAKAAGSAHSGPRPSQRGFKWPTP